MTLARTQGELLNLDLKTPSRMKASGVRRQSFHKTQKEETQMLGKRKKFPLFLWFGVFLLDAASSARPAPAADSPMAQIQATVEKILAVVQNPDLKPEAKREQRRAELRRIIYPKFDFAEMAKRSLGPEWQRHTPEEQQEFTKAFTGLLENSYLDKIESYDGEKFRYLRETGDQNSTEVDTTVVNKKGQEFSINYKLRQVDGDWRIYDVVIENISLVNNYRSQFARVLTKSSFDQLVSAIKEKRLAAGEKEKK
jgi:phospholipid transport system substrate-binding protein